MQRNENADERWDRLNRGGGLFGWLRRLCRRHEPQEAPELPKVLRESQEPPGLKAISVAIDAQHVVEHVDDRSLSADEAAEGMRAFGRGLDELFLKQGYSVAEAIAPDPIPDGATGGISRPFTLISEAENDAVPDGRRYAYISEGATSCHHSGLPSPWLDPYG